MGERAGSGRAAAPRNRTADGLSARARSNGAGTGRESGERTAPYWTAAAARGQGDLQAAWDAAQAAWVRAPLTRDRGVALRHDLDVLGAESIVPERARDSRTSRRTSLDGGMGSLQGMWTESEPLAFRVLPVLANSHIDGQRHLQRRSRLHRLAHDFRDLVRLGLRDFEQQLVVNGEDDARVGVLLERRVRRRSSRAS